MVVAGERVREAEVSRRAWGRSNPLCRHHLGHGSIPRAGVRARDDSLPLGCCSIAVVSRGGMIGASVDTSAVRDRVSARFGLLERLGLVTPEEQQVPHSVLVEALNEFTIYLPPQRL